MRVKLIIVLVILLGGCIDQSKDERKSTATAQLNTTAAIDGEKIYKGNCAACHRPDRDATGPMLKTALQNLGSKERVIAFVKNSPFFKNDGYIISLKKKYGIQYDHNFKELQADEIMAVIYWCGPCTIGH